MSNRPAAVSVFMRAPPGPAEREKSNGDRLLLIFSFFPATSLTDFYNRRSIQFCIFFCKTLVMYEPRALAGGGWVTIMMKPIWIFLVLLLTVHYKCWQEDLTTRLYYTIIDHMVVVGTYDVVNLWVLYRVLTYSIFLFTKIIITHIYFFLRTWLLLRLL